MRQHDGKQTCLLLIIICSPLPSSSTVGLFHRVKPHAAHACQGRVVVLFSLYKQQQQVWIAIPFCVCFYSVCRLLSLSLCLLEWRGDKGRAFFCCVVTGCVHALCPTHAIDAHRQSPRSHTTSTVKSHRTSLAFLIVGTRRMTDR